MLAAFHALQMGLVYQFQQLIPCFEIPALIRSRYAWL